MWEQPRRNVERADMPPPGYTSSAPTFYGQPRSNLELLHGPLDDELSWKSGNTTEDASVWGTWAQSQCACSSVHIFVYADLTNSSVPQDVFVPSAAYQKDHATRQVSLSRDHSSNLRQQPFSHSQTITSCHTAKYDAPDNWVASVPHGHSSLLLQSGLHGPQAANSHRKYSKPILVVFGILMNI